MHLLCLLMQIVLLILPIAAAVESKDDGFGTYDYYADYADSPAGDYNYAEFEPESKSVSRWKNKIFARPKKDTLPDPDMQDVNVINGLSAANGQQNECESSTTCIPAAPTTECPLPETSTVCEPRVETTTFCAPQLPQGPPPTPACIVDGDQKAAELRDLIQHLYISQARVQLEASEIKKAQAIANEAQQQLEESANHVRAVTAALQNAQREVATSAIRAQTAQLQLAAHDQLLFAARQDVDALSSRMVGLQAAEGIAQPKYNFDVGYLMNRLHQPLTNPNKPKPIPQISMPPRPLVQPTPVKKPSDIAYYDYDYDDYY